MNKTGYVLLLLLIFKILHTAGGDIKFPCSEIPEELKSGMYCVIRDEVTEFKIINNSKSVFHYYLAITILNPKGKKYATETINYDKNKKINYIHGTAYDQFGKELFKLKAKDIEDYSNISDFSLYEDDRLKAFSLEQITYPYTVEIEYEVEQNYVYFIPPFYLYEDDEVSIQSKSYALFFPKENVPVFKTNQISIEPEKGSLAGLDFIRWNFQNIKPSKFELYSPHPTEVIPNIMAAPQKIEYAGYAGRMDSWENYGKWILELNKGRGELSESTKLKVKEITSSLPNKEEKVKALYNYLQNRTRYVSIQLGIGGWQPFPASTVEESGYGDCKALSNYMVSLLSIAGIKGYYTLIEAGNDKRPLSKDFTLPAFNHIIVTVPLEKDTVWLECTSQTNPFGYIGKFTGDRYGLLIDETGGKIIKTKNYTMEENLQLRTAEVNIDKSGNAVAKVKTVYSGIQYENDGLDFVLDEQHDAQKKWVSTHTSIPNFDIISHNISNSKDIIPKATIELNLSLKKLASVSGSRVFISPNLMNKSTFIPEKTVKRNYDILRKYEYIDIDSIVYYIPENLAPEFIPNPITIESIYGNYSASIISEQGKIIYIRKVEIRKGRFNKETSDEFIRFYTEMKKADNTKIVFVAKT